MTPAADAIVVGAGIVGAACARALRAEGMRVDLVDAGFPGGGVTAAGMGHLVVLDESAAELELSLLSLRLWRAFAEAHPGVGEVTRCGTLWVAEDEAQLARARERATRLNALGWPAEVLGADEIGRAEPALRRGLAGAVRVAGDAVVYAPAVAHAICRQLQEQGSTLYRGRTVARVETSAVVLDDGTQLRAQHIVVAAGPRIGKLMPEVPVFARKGHLAITDRYPGTLTHQVVSMAYGQSTGGGKGFAVAANVQPRVTGQCLIGSSRQEGRSDSAIDQPVLRAVMDAAIALVPALAAMRIVRCWTGLRPATPDGHPLIGAHPSRRGVWLVAGHEGLGITTAFASARLLADQMLGHDSEIDASHYLPARFGSLETAYAR